MKLTLLSYWAGQWARARDAPTSKSMPMGVSQLCQVVLLSDCRAYVKIDVKKWWKCQHS